MHIFTLHVYYISSFQRIAIFKLMGALALLFQRDKTITQQKFDILSETFFSLLFREMSAKSGNVHTLLIPVNN